jgi:methylmalonyl-CoA carboxyltransferase small subunit
MPPGKNNHSIHRRAYGGQAGANVDDSRVCRSPVAGIVMGVHVQAGDVLQVDDLIVVLEAMKMETRIGAPVSRRLKSIKVAPGDAVRLNQILTEFE